MAIHDWDISYNFYYDDGDFCSMKTTARIYKIYIPNS